MEKTSTIFERTVTGLGYEVDCDGLEAHRVVSVPFMGENKDLEFSLELGAPNDGRDCWMDVKCGVFCCRVQHDGRLDGCVDDAVSDLLLKAHADVQNLLDGFPFGDSGINFGHCCLDVMNHELGEIISAFEERMNL